MSVEQNDVKYELFCLLWISKFIQVENYILKEVTRNEVQKVYILVNMLYD